MLKSWKFYRGELAAEGVRPSDLKRFTKRFYMTFCAAQKAAADAVESGKTNAEAWHGSPVYSTLFYKLSGSAYCHFLELYAAAEDGGKN